MLNRPRQQFLLIGKEEPDLASQCRNRDRDNVVDFDDLLCGQPADSGDGVANQWSGCVTARRSSWGIPAKSPGLHVYSGTPWATALAAMSAS